MRKSLSIFAAATLGLAAVFDRLPPVVNPGSSGLPDSSATNKSGITTLSISQNGQSYYTIVKAGELNFRVALDTASSDLWLTSSDCSTNACKNIPRYPTTRYTSPTFQSVNDNSTKFNVSYADGTSASGFVARESIQIANITVPAQLFGVVTDTTFSFNDQISGVLGLGFPRLSSMKNLATNSTPWFVHLAQQGILRYPMFGIGLTRNSSGTLTIGAVDGSVVNNRTASLIGWNRVVQFSPVGTENNVSSYLHWALPLPTIYLNQTELRPTPSYANVTGNTSLALIDIGASGIYGPFHDVSRLFSLVESSRLVDPAGQWAIPCDSRVSMTFAFGRHNYTLQPSDYLIGPTAGNPSLCLTWPRALPPSSDGLDWQLGTPFLRTVYSIFSYGINSKEAPMIGFLPLRNASSLNETSTDVQSFLSAQSATLATTLPNFPLSTPIPTTPAYLFNTSVSAPTGGVVQSELATRTYQPLLTETTQTLPNLSLDPSLATFIITDTSGAVQTSVSNAPQITLGLPGWSNAATTGGFWSARKDLFTVVIAVFVYLLINPV